MDAPAPLEIHLFGGFRVAVHGRTVPNSAWRQRRAAAVVKLLALAPSHRLHREQVIEALWPELDGEAAANNLRVAMHRARSRLEEAGAPRERFLVRDGEDVVLADSDGIWIDVDAYETAVARAWLSEDPAASREVLDRYAGDLLPEDLYEDWAANRRAELRASHLTLLARLAQLHEQRGELGRAIAALQRLLAAEPLDEAAHLALIRLFARAGETRQAATQYERLAELLERELGAEPNRETRELIAAIRAGRFPTEAEPFAPVTPEQPGGVAPGPATTERIGGLPAPMEALIGREREIAEVRRLFASHRLVTLTGPAGVGKTRLALAVAQAMNGDRRGNVRVVDLAPLRDPALVLPSIARAFGVRDESNLSIVDSVAAHLGGKPTLLVLDNFEQITAAAPHVADLLASCPGLTVLVTSRGRLRLRGEQEYPVQPLALPERERIGERPTPIAPADYPAVALFVRRACEADPGFALDEGNSRAVADICLRLDGLPLAIELAAARVRILPPAVLLDRLEKPLTVLTGGPRDAPARQQTLRAAIAWSHELLNSEEQRLFRNLSVFAGGFTLEAADEVGSPHLGARPASHAVPITHHPSPITLDVVASLVEQSLLRRLPGANGETPPSSGGGLGGEVRFGMLETIREYALEQLEESAETTLLRVRHAAFFLALAERIEPALTGPEAASQLIELEREHDNLRAALTTLSAQGEPVAALRLAAALWRFWWLHGHLGEGRARLEQALAEGASAPAEIRAEAIDGAGALATAQGDLTQAATLHAQALQLWRQAADRPGEIRALINLGLVADEQGDPRRAKALLEEALLLARQVEDRRGMAVALLNLGQVAMTLAEHERAAVLLGESVALFRELGDQRSESAILANLGLLALLIGDFPRARTCHEEALNLFRGLGDRQGEAYELLNLGHAVQRLGDLERAATLFTESLELFEQLGDRSGMAFALSHLGWLAHLHGDDVEAESLLTQGLSVAQVIDDRVAIAEAMEGLAGVLCATGEATRAARLTGAAEALRETIGVPLPEVHRADYQRCLSAARHALGEQAFAAARSEGHALMLAGEVIAPLELLSGDGDPSSLTPLPPSPIAMGEGGM